MFLLPLAFAPEVTTMLSHLKFEILSPTASFFLYHQVEMESLQDSWPYDVSVVLVRWPAVREN